MIDNNSTEGLASTLLPVSPSTLSNVVGDAAEFTPNNTVLDAIQAVRIAELFSTITFEYSIGNSVDFVTFIREHNLFHHFTFIKIADEDVHLSGDRSDPKNHVYETEAGQTIEFSEVPVNPNYHGTITVSE